MKKPKHIDLIPNIGLSNRIFPVFPTRSVAFQLTYLIFFSHLWFFFYIQGALFLAAKSENSPNVHGWKNR
jgi:hypothetical protein